MTGAGGRTLHLISAGAARGLAQAVIPAFEAAHGVRVAATYGAVGAMRERFDAGSACDVLVLTAAAIETCVQRGTIVAASRAPLGRVQTGLAVRSGDAAPGVADAASLAAAIVSADAIFFPDPQRATAGIHFVGVLERLGVRGRVQDALRPYESGAAAMAAMASATERTVLGCTQVTEILYTPGVALVGRLPAGFGLDTPYGGGVATASAAPPVAASFLATLAGPASAGLRRAGGFEG